MNIFAVTNRPHECANMLDDVRVRKMLIESAQMLATACHLNGVWTPEMYQPTHEHHPCTRWAARTRGNWEWLFDLYCELRREARYRFDKDYKAFHKMMPLADAWDSIPGPTYLEPFQNSARNPEVDFTGYPVHLAYRVFMVWKWRHFKREPVWTRRESPSWRYSTRLYAASCHPGHVLFPRAA